MGRNEVSLWIVKIIWRTKGHCRTYSKSMWHWPKDLYVCVCRVLLVCMKVVFVLLVEWLHVYCCQAVMNVKCDRCMEMDKGSKANMPVVGSMQNINGCCSACCSGDHVFV